MHEDEDCYSKCPIQHGAGKTSKYYREKTGQVGEGSCSSYTSQHGTDLLPNYREKTGQVGEGCYSKYTIQHGTD